MPEIDSRVVTGDPGIRAAAFDLLGACAVVLDGNGVIVDTNESWRLFTHLNDGDPNATGIGTNYLAVCDRAAAAGIAGAATVAIGLRQILAGGRLRMDHEYRCPSPTEDRWFLLQASAAPIADGNGAVVFHIDITSHKLLSERLVTLANHDALTGLPNRRSAVQYLDEQLGAARLDAESVWVFYIDLNGFGDINERYGHHVGDELLCKVAVRARGILRKTDRLCRYGGDEFVVICPALGRPGVLALASRMRQLMDEPFQIGEMEVRCGASVGYAESDADSTVDTLFASAEQQKSRDKRRHSTQTDDARRLRTMIDERRMAAAPTRNELIVHGRRMAVLVAAQRVIAAIGFDRREVAERVAGWAVAISHADAVTVEVLDGDEFVCQAAIGLEGLEVGTRRAFNGSNAAAFIAGEQAAEWSYAADSGLRSRAVVPILVRDGDPAVGSLTVASWRAHAFTNHDLLALEMLAGMAGGVMANDELVIVLERTAARYSTLVEHLPGTAVMIFDQELCLLFVAGTGVALWVGQREIVPGQNLRDLATPEELAVLEPFYRGALVEAASLDLLMADPPLELHLAAWPIANAEGAVDQLMVLVTDLTGTKADEGARNRADAEHRMAFEEGPVGMSHVGLTGRLEAVNAALCRLTGYSEERLCASDFVSITHGDDIEGGRKALTSMVSGATEEYRTEKRMIHADGHEIWIALSTALVRDDNDVAMYFLSHYVDITDRKRFESELSHLAEHDPVTGLANRSSFKTMLNRHVARVVGRRRSGALLVLDLDHFKQVNDTLGHRVGDELVIAMADVLRRYVRKSDVIGRLGGDEFGVILPSATREQAEGVATKLLDAVRDETTMLGGRHRRKVTTSIGIAMIDGSSTTGADILVNADLAMYDAKEAGRDRYIVHEPTALRPSTRDRLAWVDRITDALEHDRFTLFAQPIMELESRTITRHELLLRMVDPDGQIISPMSFLGVAEKFGLINRIDRWVVDHAISVLAAHPEHDLAFEVNLSGMSMGDAEFLAFIEQRLAESPGVEPSQLTFEVTETAAVANLSSAREFADRLSILGCSFALDDFGSGFGGFYYLKYLPFSDLKIDGEFVLHCTDNLTDRLVIDAVVAIARGLGKCTIAEYVEDAQTLEYLATCGVDYAQGFHVGHPMPIAEALESISVRS
jgi:diguanylate cyclase (GGDEF)-like protein/PAS domain S-box-containing protein